ncbi:MAG: TM0106 family RecB-like putative nuclease [Rubrivivax sp.]|nr:TM0106 family RecB-like putative nuclease [Rubrivivax sp.]
MTPTLLAGHLACRHLTQLERQRRAGTLTVEYRADPRLDALIERGRRHEDAYVEALRREGRRILDLRGLHDVALTRQAMDAGYDAIVQAPLSNDEFIGTVDVLLRVDLSATGPMRHIYEPVDTKLARETKGGTVLQLCTYCELLEALQGVQPERFHVVTPHARETYRTAEFAAYYRHARGQLLEAASASPPPSTYPEPVEHCDVCKYWLTCDSQRRRDDHPSLIAGIRTSHRREFEAQRLLTLSDIAHAEGRLPLREPVRGNADTYLRLGRQARLQLQSRQLAVPAMELLPCAPGRGLARLPEPSEGDVFLDFEGDPFAGPAGLEYLTGYCVRDPAGALVPGQHWAFDAAQEKSALELFLDMALERLAQHPSMHIYHYGAYEPSALKRLSARHASRGEQLDRLLRGRRFVDLHAVVRESLCVGVERYGLKELEPVYGFVRRIELREAATARRDLEIALELNESVSDETTERVALYNLDDCRSTAALRDWLEERRSDAVTRGETVARPVVGDPAPSERVSERDQRIADLRAALVGDLPEDSASRTDEQRGRALLAALLGYFRQEEKNAWWEYFRLRELPPGDHLEEREMLAGLQFVETLPKQARQRNARCRFRFPHQETAVALGDKVHFVLAEDPRGETGSTAQVEEIDLVNRTVVLSIGDVAGAYPTVVFRDQVVGAKVLESALLGFAESVCNPGVVDPVPYRSATDLLLRRLPRRRSGRGGALRMPGESTAHALVRLCRDLDAGVLPVQGPPGCGKTFNGGRAILELAAAGKRVGVTAVSHKVIDNLLTAVREAAESTGHACPRLVHKHDEVPPDGIEYVKSPQAALGASAPGTVVGGTVWLWALDEATERLDYLFVDEAGQLALAHALAAARSATNLVMLGDPQQLEQPQRGAHEEGADVAALVHLIGAGKATLDEEQGLFLDSTYRLHPAICTFTSEMYYEGRLSPASGLERQSVAGPTRYTGAGLHLVEVEHEGNQAHASEEILEIDRIVQSLLQQGHSWTDHSGATRALGADDILVVAPYNAQVSALRGVLAKRGVTRVGTVDRFQGQEAPIVVYSCTSSSPEDAPRGMAFLYDPHRFNVATSRARCSVIVVASPRLFAPNCRTPEQMRWANGMCRFRELAAR